MALKKVYFADFGCRLNQFETRALKGSPGEIAPVDSARKADVVVINTCTVTGRADMKNRQAIKKAMAENPKARIIVTGCYATTDQKNIEGMGEKITVVPNALKFTINDLISGKKTTGEPTLFPSSFQTREKDARAYLKIQDGCNKSCSYCKIPLARGKAVSRDFNESLREIHNIIESGFKEIILTGVNIGHYKSNDLNLNSFLREIEKIPGDHFYRLSSIEPECVNDELIELFQSEKFAPFFHIPLQSGSDRILKEMRRGYRTNSYSRTIERIRKNIESAHIGTDLMAGFPGETEEDFSSSLLMVKEMEFANVHVFPFSKRPGSEIDNKLKKKSPGVFEVNGKIIKERVREILAVQEGNKLKYIERTSQKNFRAIVENVHDDRIELVTENYIRGKIITLNNKTIQKGDLLQVIYSKDLEFKIL